MVLQYHLPSKQNFEKARGMYEKSLALAEQMLAKPSITAAQRTLATEAQQNAKANLLELAKQSEQALPPSKK